MVRSLGIAAGAAVLTLGWIGAAASGQQAPAAMAQSSAAFPSKGELLSRIARCEEAQRTAEGAHADLESMVKIESNLAGLYQDAGMYAKAQAELRREIATLHNGSPNELADAMAHMAVLHIATGDLRQSEKDELEALRIRESLGDPVGTALAWSDLADIYIKQGQYKKALDYAQKALPVLADNSRVDVADRVTVRQTLALAMCGLKQCAPAIQLLGDALQLEKASYGADSLMAAAGTYLLGYAYWQNGEVDPAAGLMARGIAGMKADLGPGHAIYLNTVNQYAQFLRQRGDMEAASAVEREVKMANTVVDARTMTAASALR